MASQLKSVEEKLLADKASRLLEAEEKLDKAIRS